MNRLILLLFIVLLNFSCRTNTKNHTEYNYGVVQDFTHLFTKSEKDSLSNKIIKYEAVSTNEICVYTIDSLDNNKTALYEATQIANKLGVGKKEKNNGILILISKYDKQIGIATGYGTEKIISDYMCKTIIDSTIVPCFKNGQYYKGINNAIDSIITKWN